MSRVGGLDLGFGQDPGLEADLLDGDLLAESLTAADPPTSSFRFEFQSHHPRRD